MTHLALEMKILEEDINDSTSRVIVAYSLASPSLSNTSLLKEEITDSVIPENILNNLKLKY